MERDPLISFLRSHADRCPRESGTVDVMFFGLRAQGSPTAEALRQAIAARSGDTGSVDVFDGKEHSYLQLGAWLGDQGRALELIGLGAILGLWRLITPRILYGADVDDALALRLAGSGWVCLNSDRVPDVLPTVTMPSAAPPAPKAEPRGFFRRHHHRRHR